ncbi:DMT family transporter [Denitromonas halophila]|uniref:EamA family transporter n=1 Tax=Denitromonas halophila TaxID=1629404 RepID=A0A557QFE1_9RHOO|nr:EamA family transporter [Denitromonas halophila]TVO51614.1 EamA family transporter [Denitromonas halophila]
MSATPPPRAWIALHVAVFLFGSAGLFAKGLPLSAEALVFGRTAIAAAALWLWLRWRPEAGRFRGLSLLAGPLLAVHWLSFFVAIQVSSVAIGLMGYASYPLFAAVLAALGGERPKRADWVCAGAVTLGLVVLVPHWHFGDSTLVGLSWGVLSGFSFALLASINRRISRSSGPVRLAMAQNAIAAFCLMPFVDGVMPGSATQWLWLIALGVVWTALAHTLFIACLRHVPPQTAAVVASLEPVYGIALAAMLFAELPGMREWIGGVLIIGVTVWTTLRRSSGA